MVAYKSSYILMTLIMAVLLFSTTYAQDSLGGRSGVVVNDKDYDCFKSISCIQNNKVYKQNGLKIRSNNVINADHYTINGESNNISLNARYNSEGELINGRLVLINTRLPEAIRQKLVCPEGSSWQMLGNEKVVHDFNTESTEYKVIMRKGDDVVWYYFDYEGNIRDRFPRG